MNTTLPAALKGSRKVTHFFSSTRCGSVHRARRIGSPHSDQARRRVRCLKSVLALLAAVVLSTSVSSAAPASSLPLEELLDRVGEQVVAFWNEFSVLSCQEKVDQVKINEKGKVVNERESVYDYVVLMKLIGNDLVIEEARDRQTEIRKKKKIRPRDRPLLVTNGFAIMLLVFHPHYQGSYVFTRRLETPEQEGLVGLDFVHAQGERSPSVLQLEGRSYPLEWKGTAWFDSDLHIVRMQTGLKEPLAQIGLQRLASEVRYEDIVFAGLERPRRLPVWARIEAQTARQTWLNTHVFSEYEEFSVQTDVQFAEPAAGKQ